MGRTDGQTDGRTGVTLKGQIPVGPTGEIWGVARQKLMG